MNSMTYKGLTARIEFDEREGIFRQPRAGSPVRFC